MRTSFLHLADVRLGYHDPADPRGSAEQLGKQFRFVIDYALEQRVSFVVFAGDLFDSPQVDPAAFQVALRGLSRLAEKGVAAIAIRGRHEVVRPGGELTWYEMLSDEGLVVLLAPQIRARDMALERWTRRELGGSFFDLGRSRLFGMPYYGAMTGVLLPALADAIVALDNRETDFRMVLLHAQLEHFSEEVGPKLSYGDLLLLRRHVDYVALGSCQSTYDAEGWVYNPGPGGFFHVSVDTVVQPKHAARYVAYPEAISLRWPPAPRVGAPRHSDEERLFDEIATSGTGTPAERALKRDLIRLVTESVWGGGDIGQLEVRLLEAAARG